MKKYLGYLFFLTLLFTSNAFAEPTSASEVFTQLGDTAGNIGKGLRDAGFIIAGFGLIVFSFMAIFNKISWKTLAYIMLSTFILSVMIGVISYIQEGGKGTVDIKFGDVQSSDGGGGSPRVDSGHRN